MSSPTYFTQTKLAARWRISLRTLERWRWLGEGLPFFKIGGRVAYWLQDIKAFESAQLHTRTDLPANPPADDNKQSN